MENPAEEELRKLKQKVDAREETRQWIQKKKQERYEAHLLELEAKKQDEERKKQHRAEFAATMKHLKMKASHNKPPTARPPSLLSKMQRGSHAAALASSNITKLVQSSEKLSPKATPSSSRDIAGQPNARTKESIASPRHAARKKASQQSSIMSQSVDSKASADNWLLRSDAAKRSPVRSTRSSPRSIKGPTRGKSADGLFSSRSEKQRILESCKSSIMKPVVAPPMRAVAPPETKPRPPLSMNDLRSRPGEEKETQKRKSDEHDSTDCKKLRQESRRSVLVSSASSHPHSRFYHFTYVDPPDPAPSPLNVSLCSEFNETSSSRALAGFNDKVDMLKRALSQEFKSDTFVGTLEKSLNRDAVARLNAQHAAAASHQQTLNANSRTNSCRPASQSQTRHDADPSETKENRADSATSASFELTQFRDPTPFNFTSAMRARLNMLTSEKERELAARKRQQGRDQRKKQRGGERQADISELISQYVANCQRNVEQLKACSATQAERQRATAPGQFGYSNPARAKNHASRRAETQTRRDPREKSLETPQFSTFMLDQSGTSCDRAGSPINRTYDRALQPLPLNVEDLKLQLRTTSTSTASSCVDFSEVRLFQQKQSLNTSQIPERDGGSSATRATPDESDATLVETINDSRGAKRPVHKRCQGSSKPKDIGNCNKHSKVHKASDKSETDAGTSDQTLKKYKTYKVSHDRASGQTSKPHKVSSHNVAVPPSGVTHDVTDNVPQYQRSNIPIENPESRKKSAFYSVPPSGQSQPPLGECLTRPDISLSPRRKQDPVEINFRRISSTPTSSLKSIETFKDSDSLSDIPQAGLVQPVPSSVGKDHTSKHPDTFVCSVSKPNIAGKCSKSVATQSSFLVSSLPLSQSCTSDTLCGPLTEVSRVASCEPKNKQKSIFTVKNWTSPKFSLELLDKMIKAEEERQKQSKIILKLQSKAVIEKVMSELSRLEAEKKALKECSRPGESSSQQSSERLRILKKRQRGLLIRLNQEREQLNATSKQLLIQSQERIQQLTSQYNHLRTQLDTKAVLKVIDDSFRFHDDVTDSDLPSACSPEAEKFNLELPSNVAKLKAFSSLPEGLDRGDMCFTKPVQAPRSKHLESASQPKILKDQCTSPLGFTLPDPPSHEAPTPAPEPSRKSETPLVIPMKPALYPKYLRRLSSGSEDSFIYSHNETISDQSDLELRIRSLKDQLTKRKLESERLKKELKSVRAENLKAKEASLLQQIRFYDKHIKLAAQELENEKENLVHPALDQIMKKPMILKPHNKVTLKTPSPTVAPTNASSLEETSDHTLSSHDYLKETFDTESDKLNASDSTHVVNRESNDSLEPVVITEEHQSTMPAAAAEGPSESLIKIDTTNREQTLVNSDEAINGDGKLCEILKTNSDESDEVMIKNESVTVLDEQVMKKEAFAVNANDGLSSPKHSEVVEEHHRLSSRNSETISEILTELDDGSNRDDIAEDALSSERSKDSLIIENTHVEIVTDRASSEETHVETARTSSVDKDSNTDGGTLERVEETESDAYEETNVASEVLQVSFREKTINETFIVHEESLNFENRKSGDNRHHPESDIIEELSEVSSSCVGEEDNQSPVLEELRLSPKEPTDESPIEDVATDLAGDGEDSNGRPVKDKQAGDENGSAQILSEAANSEAKPAFTGDKTHESKPPTGESLDASDILSPNISDLQDYVSPDFITLGNYSLIRLSPSKAPETPFLHALSRDYQMSRKIQLDQISNEIISDELNASIESIVSLYKTDSHSGAKLTSDRAGEDDVGSVEEDIDLVEDPDLSLSEKIDFLSLNAHHQKDISWTEEDEWYNENFGLSLEAPPAVVAEVLLQKERQIEEEIEKIKQLTSSIDMASLSDPETLEADDPSTRRKLFCAYPYLREIPDKPPPPYIEPASSVPASEEEISAIVEAMVQSLRDPEKEVPSSNIARIRMYYSFLHDLTRDVYSSITAPHADRTDTQLPWLQPRVKTRLCQKKPPTDPQEISARVVSEVLELLSLRPSKRPDSFLVRWSRPRRDFVDEMIVQESKAEEAMWTGYQTEETEIKNEITELILQELLEDTVGVFQRLLVDR